jgi:hypothetical protein
MYYLQPRDAVHVARNADAGVNKQASNSAIDRMQEGWRQETACRAPFVSRDDDLSSEGNVSRRCANADAETLRRSSRVSAKTDRWGRQRGRQDSKTASGCRTLRAQHGESLSAVRERQTRQTRQRGVCGYGMPCHYSSRPPFSAPLSDK